MNLLIKRIFFALVLLFGFSTSGHGKDISVLASGKGQTEQEALLAAKRSAVEKGIGGIIFSQTEVNNFMLQKEIVISKTIGSIKKVDVLSENQTLDGLVEIKIDATVSQEGISNDLNALGILMESMDRPRMMVFVNESFAGQRTHICETALIKRFKDRRFNIVDPMTVASFMENDEALVGKIISGDHAAALQFATNHGAEVIVIGNVSTSLGPKMFDMYSAQAEVSLQTVLCSNGEVIASKNIHAAAAHISKETAIRQALENAVDKLFYKSYSKKSTTSFMDDIIALWQDWQNNGATIKVTIKRVQNEKTCHDVKGLIETTDNNIVEVISRSWQKNRCELEVRYNGKTDTLSSEIDELESLAIISRSAGRIVVGFE